MYKKGFHNWFGHIDFILLDEISLFLVLLFMAVFFPSRDDAGIVHPYGFLILVLEINLLLIIASGFFDTVIHNNDWVEFKLTLKHGMYLLFFSLLAMLIRDGTVIYSRFVLFLSSGLYILVSYLTRILWRRILLQYKRNKETQKAMLIITKEKYAPEILHKLKEYAFGRYAASGIVLIERDGEGETIEGVPVVANLSNAADYLCKSWTDEVLFFHSSHDERIQPLIEKCREMAITLHFYAPIQGIGENKQTIEHIAGFAVLTANLNLMTSHDALMKRVFDFAFGLLGSVAALIVMAIVAPIIKKASPGPLLFKQERIGENGKRFKMYKIRSMYMDADQRKTELEDQNSHDDGMLFKMEFDPRVIGNRILPDGTQKTGIGDFIRRTSLDEMPQFFNVLRGEMSVVGTRPPTVDEWEKYQYHHRARMSICPGVTGLWQINARKDKMPFDEVVKLDTQYIATWSMSRDLLIIVKTVMAMFKHVKS